MGLESPRCPLIPTHLADNLYFQPTVCLLDLEKKKKKPIDVNILEEFKILGTSKKKKKKNALCSKSNRKEEPTYLFLKTSVGSAWGLCTGQQIGKLNRGSQNKCKTGEHSVAGSLGMR